MPATSDFSRLCNGGYIPCGVAVRVKASHTNKRLSKESGKTKCSVNTIVVIPPERLELYGRLGVGGGYLSLELRELALGRSEEHKYLLEPHICQGRKKKTLVTSGTEGEMGSWTGGLHFPWGGPLNPRDPKMESPSPTNKGPETKSIPPNSTLNPTL